MWQEVGGGEGRRQCKVRVRGRRHWEGTVRNLGCVLWTYQVLTAMMYKEHRGKKGESFLLMCLAGPRPLLEWKDLW